MITNVLNPKWQGDTAAPINPTEVRFKAAPAPEQGECTGCIFCGQRSSVCFQAAEIAVAGGGVDCDVALPDGQTVIYVADTSDPRQMALLEGEG